MSKPTLYIIDDVTKDEYLFPTTRGRGFEPELVEGYGSVAEPFPQELLIPRSEWPARIKEKEERKTRLSDFVKQAGLKCKDQANTNYCVTEDTEVLTDRGWVQWPNYNGSDLLGTMNPGTGMLEFQAPIATHVYEHNGPMVYSTNRSIDFGVTPDHRMLVRKWDESRRTLSDQYSFQRAGDLGWYFGLPSAPSGFLGTELVKVRIEGDREYDGDDFIRLVSMVVSDGYAGGTDKTRNWVSFACFGDGRQEEARALAARIGFRECPGRSGVFVRYDAAALANWFRANAYTSPELGSKNKKIPGIVKECSGRQISLFLTTYGDQSHSKKDQLAYFSTSKQAIDDLQELALRIGKRGSIWKQDRDGKKAILEDGQVATSHGLMYHLHIRQSDRLSIERKHHLETDWYKGPVYCATVPNSTLVTRRNGSVLISGNCWINSPAYCLEVLRVVQNQPLVYLSPASGGAQIKNYRNQGGWGREALQWISDKGLNTVDRWPANAIDRRYATAENREQALQYRVTEWMVVSTLDEYISCLLRNIPVSGGYNWWRHQTSAEDALWIDGEIATGNRNSWGLQYGSEGYFVLQGRRMLPDDMVAPRVAVAS